MELIKVVFGCISLFLGLNFFGLSLNQDKVWKRIMLSLIAGLLLSLYKIL